MRSFVPLALAALFLAGCGKKAPPAAAGVSGPGATLVPVSLAPPDLGSDVYQGRTADQWGDQLLNPNVSNADRYQASQALASLKTVGYRHLKKAMESNSDPVRLQALQAVSVPMMLENKEETVPMLMSMLNHQNPAIREQAAYRLGWFDTTGSNRIQRGHMAPERAQALLKVYQSDGERNVRLAAWNSLISVHDALRGTLDCPKLPDGVPEFRGR